MTESTPLQNRTWKLWERPEKPQPINIQPRDAAIMLAVARHHFIQPHHLHALFGDPLHKLALRTRKLWQNGYLDRPMAIRPTRVLTDQMVYCLTNKGARELERRDPNLHISKLQWSERPDDPTKLVNVEHQLGVATFFVMLQVACTKLGYRLHWDGHLDRDRHFVYFRRENKYINSDGFFVLERSDGMKRRFFLEFDRTGRKKPDRVYEKLLRYFNWWDSGEAEELLPHGAFRVLVVVPTEKHMQTLRRATTPIGRERNPQTWRGFMFSHLEAFSPTYAERILAEPIFYHADDDTPVSLIS